MNIYCPYTCVCVYIYIYKHSLHYIVSKCKKNHLYTFSHYFYNTIKTVQRILSESKLQLQLSILFLLGRWFCLNQNNNNNKKKKKQHEKNLLQQMRFSCCCTVSKFIRLFVTSWTVA